jgi:hypothetical protein
MTFAQRENPDDRRARKLRVQEDATKYHRSAPSNPFCHGHKTGKRRKKAHLRKYSSPTLRVSKKLGRNLKSTLFGGRAGSALLACGNEETSLCLSSSNSEYLNRTTIGPPYQPTSQLRTTTTPDPDPDPHIPHITCGKDKLEERTHIQRMHRTIPHHISTHPRHPLHDAMVRNTNAARPETTTRLAVPGRRRGLQE